MADKDIEKIAISTKEQRIKLSNNLALKVRKCKDFYLGTTGKITKKTRQIFQCVLSNFLQSKLYYVNHLNVLKITKN